MDKRDRTAIAIGVMAMCGVCALGLVAGLSANQQPDVQVPAAAGAAPPMPPAVCGICGVVETVREVEPERSKHEVSTVVGGGMAGIAVLLGSLRGISSAGGPGKTYEVTVRMADGSLRAARQPTSPGWKAGDRVKFLKGRIEGLT